MQLLEGLVFTPIIKDVLIKYMDCMMSALLYPRGIFQNLTWQTTKHARRMMSSQRELGQRLKVP